jgi:16S rRNA processing protein RimM
MADRRATSTTHVVLGRVSGVFGIRGWVKVFSYTDPREGILDYRDCLLARDDRWVPATIVEGQRHGKGIILRLQGVDDREAAAALIGTDIAVPRDRLPEPEDGSFYWADLEGLEVRHVDGSVLGRVDHLLETGANDVLVVRKGINDVLIPFVVDSVVKNVDLRSGVIEVDWEWD